LPNTVLESLTAIFSIIIIDLVLSGDNAVVIGMAARNLSPENRRKAIIFGGAGAIGLRVLFTALATVLLGIPGLQLVGGFLLFYIAYKLIRPQGGGHSDIKQAGSLREAIQTIVLADVVMSLDNILAVGAAAHGDIRLLMFGLLLSIPIILFGSALVANLLGRFPALLYLGVFVLVHAAVAMILHDPTVAARIHTATWQEFAISLVVTGLIVGLVKLMERSLTEPDFAAALGGNEHQTKRVPPDSMHARTEPVVPVRQGDESGRRVST
jgi:YjbE family integral membrane protein